MLQAVAKRGDVWPPPGVLTTPENPVLVVPLACRRYGRKIGHAVELQETQGIGYGLSRMVIGCSQALLLGGVLLRGAGMVFGGTLSGEKLTTFVFYTNFVVTASFDVGDQVHEGCVAESKHWLGGSR